MSAATFIWARIPAVLGRFSPTASHLLSDGRYLSAWSPAAIVTPLVALAAGIAAALLQSRVSFTSSLLAITAFAMVSGLGAGVGAYSLLGYVVADLARFLAGASPYGSDIIGRPSLYFVLASLVLLVPVSATVLREELLYVIRVASRWPRMVLHGLLSGVLVFAWAQAAAFLVRPVWSFSGRSPDVASIAPLQHEWGWYVVAGAGVAFARAYLETVVADRKPSIGEAVPVIASPGHAPTWRSALLGSLAFCLALAGLFDSWLDAVVVFLALAGVLFLKERAARTRPIAWLAAKVPLVVRLAITLVCAYVMAIFLVEPAAAHSSSFRPMVASIIGSLLVAAVLLPRTPP